MRFLVPPTQGTGRSPSLSGRGHRQSQESHLESEIKPGQGLKSLEAGKGLVLLTSVCPVTNMKLTALKMSHKRAGKTGMGGEGWGRRKGPRVGSFTSHDPSGHAATNPHLLGIVHRASISSLRFTVAVDIHRAPSQKTESHPRT